MKNLKRYRSGGVYYVYHRSTGVRLPAHLDENDPVFLEAYIAAEAAVGEDKPTTPVVQTVAPGSVEWIARSYLGSPGFRELSDAYQRVRRNDITRLLKEKDGQMARVPFAQIGEEHVRRNIHTLGGNPGRERRKTWAALAEHAYDLAITTTNVVERVKGPKTKKTEGHIPWALEQVAQYREHWAYGTEERLLFEELYWFGSRISDTVTIGPGDVDHDGFISFRQSKTGGEVWIPFARELPAFAVPEDLAHLKRAIAAVGPRHGAFHVTRAGKVRSKKAASQWFSAAARAAGVTGRTAHGLRKSRMILHAERGATTIQIAAWSGHESLKEVERYVRRASRKRALMADDPSVGSVIATVGLVLETLGLKDR